MSGKSLTRKKIYKKNLSPHAVQKIKKAGLVVPQPKLTAAEFAKLQQQWYAKAQSSGFKDIEWVDHSTGKGHNTPHLKGSLHMGKAYHSGRELYFDMANAYLLHCTSLHNYYRFIWKLHCEGKTYDFIWKQVKKHYNSAPSKYTIFYDIQKIAKKCYRWNKRSENGVLKKREDDKIAKSVIDEMLGLEYNWILGNEPID